MTSFISLVAFGFLIYYAIKLFKGRKLKATDQASKRLKKRYRAGLVISILIMFIFGSMGGHNETTSKQSSSADTTKVVKKQKYIGKDKYDIAKKENVALLAKQKKLQAKEDKLQEQQDKIASDEAEAKRKEQEQQAAAQKQQEEAAAQQKQQEQSQQAASQTQTRGDMNTSDTGTIVGNANSHIYHVPGQAGYRMNSANAVYFHSEQEAIAAGYRRAKR
ncbi:DNA-entry nuclease [Companilactobacillus zhachilii]|uniref:sunset domain-containing protein n=1 Tax=Companilactobacillus zhachilii TaxID=2304606 RepID=UPI001923D236|nr:DNA-entry nuclease [Companilactobacillus zhachilii]MBL3531619.1 DNA-entry nuclease [Companilactobacillus zhachilii]